MTAGIDDKSANVAPGDPTTTQVQSSLTAPGMALPSGQSQARPNVIIPAALRTIADQQRRLIGETAAKLEVVSSMILAPAPARVDVSQPDNGVRDMIIVPILPEGTSDMVTRLWALRLAAGLRSNQPYDQRVLAGTVIALFYILYPDTTRKTRDTEWMAYTLTAAEVTNILTVFDEGRKLPPLKRDSAGQPDGLLKAKLLSLNSDYKISHTPGLGAVSAEFFRTQQDWLMFHGYVGLLLFTMHKDAKTGSGKALLDARPLALRSKYSKTESEYVLWSEIGRPQAAAYSTCSVAWRIMPQTRLYLMSEFVTSSSGVITAEREALFTTVRLMRWTDASHVVIINEALATFPYLRACPMLTGDLGAYSAGMKQIYEMMPEYTDPITRQRMRDTTTMPYIKALYGDKRSIAQRNTMPLLLAVSLRLLTPSRPTLTGYQGPTGYQMKVDDIVAWHTRVVEMMTNEGL